MASISASKVPEIDEFVDRALEVFGEFLVGDAVNLPADPTSVAIPALVALRVESAAVPGDVVDFDRPFDLGIGPVGMDHRTRAEAERKLANKRPDAAPFEFVEHR